MSVGKLQRIYRLDIFTPDGDQITVAPPFSLQFNITRNTLASANKATLTLYNLGPSTRSRVFKDRFSTTEYFRVSLFAGYGNRLHAVFIGNILEAYSYRDQTEWVTVIDAFDGLDAIQNGFTAQTVTRDTSLRDIILSVIDDMPNVIAGILGSPAEGTTSRGQVLLGQSSEIMDTLTNRQFFIDLETVNVLAEDEAIQGLVTRLDPSVLLQTPRRRQAMLEVVTLFEPQIQIGQIYEIESLEPIYNGQYIVIGFTHDVTISEAQSGEARSTIQLYFGAEGIRQVSA